MTDLFSERIGAVKPAPGLIYEAAPSEIITGLLNFFSLLNMRTLNSIYSAVCLRLDVYVGDSSQWGHSESAQQRFFQQHITDDSWFRFYDICEIVWNRLPTGGEKYLFQNHLNSVFGRNRIGYEMRDGKVERVGSRLADEVVASARGILTDERLAGPNEQFLKALGFFNQRPKPDLENAVKEAIGAAEGLTRIITGKKSIVLSDAVKKWRGEGEIPATLLKAIDGIYAYRGDTEGVGHGKVGVKELAYVEAEFVLHCSAAIIVYLAQLHGYSVT